MGKAEERPVHNDYSTRDTSQATIVLVDDSLESLAWLAMTLRREGLRSEHTAGAGDALRRLSEKQFDVVIVNANLAELSGSEFAKMAKVLQPEAEVYLASSDGSEQAVFQTIRSMGREQPGSLLDLDRFKSSVREAGTKKVQPNGDSSQEDASVGDISFGTLVGRCEPMQEVFRLIEKVAGTVAPVIIQGESGTGKELVARAIHKNSRRKHKKFMAINSASLPETLLESELFGYRRGAFTGARRDKIGLLESAHAGTLLMDEIGSMSKHLQGKLLRAMQDGEILPVGSSERIKIDVRILAASNRNLGDMVESGEFRKDLYYRLNVIEITLPPLRERGEDIPLLVEYFLQKYNREEGTERKVISKPAMAKLLKYTWPGNVRELENVVRRALIISRGRVVKVNEIELRGPGRPNISERPDLLSMRYRDAKRIVHSEFQRAYVKRLLSDCGGNVSKAANRAGLSRQALHQMAKQYGLK